MSNILDAIQVSGASYDLKDKNAPSVSSLTQSEYDNLPSTAKTSNTFFVITDAQAGDLTNYYTKTETNTLLGGKQDTLVSSTNIKTINNESILGSGNIDIQGGGKAIEAGRGIAITTGETADTVSFNLPISAGTGDNSVVFGISCQARGSKSFAGGQGSTGLSEGSFAFGQNCKAAQWAIAVGNGVNASNIRGAAAFGQYNVVVGNMYSAASAITIFSVGNGDFGASHNAFEIRQNGDIYISSGGTDILLQDHLGGGGASYSAGTGIDITNNVISVSGVVETSAITTTITSSSTDAQVPSAKAVYDIVGDIETLLSQI